MRIKTFEIRIDPMMRERDERALNEFLSDVCVLRVHCGCLRARNSWAVIVFYDGPPAERPAPCPKLVGTFLPDSGELTPQECARFEALRTWRNDRAASMGRKPFVIASTRDLVNVARSRIASPEDLLAVSGFGPAKIERYGEEIVAVLDSLAEPAD